MRMQIRRHLTTIIVAMVTAAITAGGPALAAAVAEAVNADTVDGKHAVGAGASVANRKGKLVATSGTTGRLPNNIISKAPNANQLDGIDSTGFLRKGAKAADSDKLDGLTSSQFARAVMPRGGLMTGEYSSRGIDERDVTINFRIPLSEGVPHTFVPEGGPFTTECPGYGQAATGHLCVYERFSFFSTFYNVFHMRGEGYGGAAGASADGFVLYFDTSGSAGSDGTSIGEWAVRAP